MLLFWALVIIAILEGMRRISARLTDYTPSPNRDQPFEIVLADDLRIFSDGPVHSTFFQGDFLPASIGIHHQEQLFWIDPLRINDTESADAILISHDHPDHCSPEDIRKLYQAGKTRVIGPRAVAARLPDLPVEVLQPGAVLELSNWTVTGIPAYSTGIPTHPRRAGYLGFLLTCGPWCIYHAGDTHAVLELETLQNLTMAIIPIRGGLFTMSTREAAALIKRLQPQIVFPIHYPLGKREPDLLRELVGDAALIQAYPE